MTGKQKGIICGTAMVLGAGLIIYGMAARDGESGGVTIPVIGLVLFVGAWVALKLWSPSKKTNP